MSIFPKFGMSCWVQQFTRFNQATIIADNFPNLVILLQIARSTKLAPDVIRLSTAFLSYTQTKSSPKHHNFPS